MSIRPFFNKTQDSEVVYTGPTNSKLGIKSGDLLSDVINKLSDAISNAPAQLIQTTTTSSDLKADSLLFDLVDHTESMGLNLDGKKVSVTIKQSDQAGKVNISFTTPSNDLPPEFVPVGTETTVRTYDVFNRLLGSSSAKNGAFSIEKVNVPVLINSRINLKTANGDYVLSRTFHVDSLTNATLSGSYVVNGISISDLNELSQKQYNEVLASNISRLQKSVDALNSEKV